MTARKRGLWESVYYAIVHSRTLTLTTSLYLPGERAHIDRILGAFLEAAGMEQLRNNLAYCVHELAGNAKKANMKRLYFKEKNLDILSKDDYARGMERFKTETIEQISHYLAGLKENGLYVKFQFRKLKKGVRVSVRNNSTPGSRGDSADRRKDWNRQAVYLSRRRVFPHAGRLGGGWTGNCHDALHAQEPGIRAGSIFLSRGRQ